MRAFGLFIAAVFCIAVNYPRFYDNYGSYYSYDNTYYSNNISQYAPAVNYNNSLPYYSVNPTQPAMNAYNAVNAYKNAVSQSIPLVNPGDPNLPTNVMLTSIDYQELSIKMLNQQAELKEYSYREKEKNDKLTRENTWENNSSPAYSRRPQSGYNVSSESSRSK